jgi:uncharacterized LabA/DUF88 family protein
MSAAGLCPAYLGYVISPSHSAMRLENHLLTATGTPTTAATVSRGLTTDWASDTPIQQPRYTTGKNATDTAMIIDAMDILYGGKIDGFCLVSSDSDFTRLASRLRESGHVVYGFGERKTPKAFVAACDKFTYVDILLEPQANAKAESKDDAEKLKSDPDLMNLLRSAIEASEDESGRANLSAVGKQISSQKPDFDPRHYGFSKLSSLIDSIDRFEIHREPKGTQGHVEVTVSARKPQRSGRRR